MWFQVLICRNYRGDVDMNIIDKFAVLLRDKEDEGKVTPILQYDTITFVYIKYSDLYCILLLIINSQIIPNRLIIRLPWSLVIRSLHIYHVWV